MRRACRATTPQPNCTGCMTCTAATGCRVFLGVSATLAGCSDRIRMAFHLDAVVPWGRTFEEYRLMFALSEEDLRGRILGCADGPASFNAEAHRRGYRVVSCDPLYRFDRQQIRRRIDATCNDVLEQT